MDRSGTILWQNAASLALIGDWRGRLFFGAVAPDHRHGARASFTRQMLGIDGSVARNSVALGPDGARRLVHVQRIPLENDDGVVGAFGILQRLDDVDVVAEFPRLTPRQHETLRLLAEGLSTDEIAAELGVALETARNYIRRLLRVLGVRSRLEAVLRAQALGLLE